MQGMGRDVLSQCKKDQMMMIHRKTRHTRDEANDPSVRLRTEGRPSGSSASTAGV